MATALKHSGHEVVGVGVNCKRCGVPSARYQRTPENLDGLKEHALSNGQEPPVVNLYTDWCELPSCKTSAITDAATKIQYVRSVDSWELVAQREAIPKARTATATDDLPPWD